MSATGNQRLGDIVKNHRTAERQQAARLLETTLSEIAENWLYLVLGRGEFRLYDDLFNPDDAVSKYLNNVERLGKIVPTPKLLEYVTAAQLAAENVRCNALRRNDQLFTISAGSEGIRVRRALGHPITVDVSKICEGFCSASSDRES